MFDSVQTTSSSARTIAVNSAWMTLDVVVGAIAGLAASVAVARVLGPRQVGFYSYLLWAVSAAASAGALGIPAATRKYTAEYLGAGKTGVALAVVARTWRLQFVLATVTGAGALAVAFSLVPPEHRSYAILGTLSIVPAMLMDIPTAAAAAAQRYRAAVIPSLTAATTNLVGVALALIFRWGLPGLAASLLAARLADLALRQMSFRTISAELRRQAAGDRARTTEEGLGKRMRNFCVASAGLQLLSLVVWDRSEVFFLGRYCPIQQVAFHSIPFNMTTQALLFARAFSSSAGASLMTRVGSSKEGAQAQVPVLFRCLALFVLPMLLGMAAISGPIVQVLFGNAYQPAAAVLVLLSLSSITRAALAPLLSAFAAFEMQTRALQVMAGCAAMNLTLDFLLIPAHGAVGAAAANGIAQCAAASLLCLFLTREMRIDLEPLRLLRTAMAAVLAVAPAAALAFLWSPWLALTAGILAGATLYGPLLRQVGAVDRADRERLASLIPFLPRLLHRPAGRLLLWLARDSG